MQEKINAVLGKDWFVHPNAESMGYSIGCHYTATNKIDLHPTATDAQIVNALRAAKQEAIKKLMVVLEDEYAKA